MTNAALAAFRAMFRGYKFSVITITADKKLYEAVTLDDANPWCLISSDPEELWCELTAAGHAAGVGDSMRKRRDLHER